MVIETAPLQGVTDAYQCLFQVSPPLVLENVCEKCWQVVRRAPVCEG